MKSQADKVLAIKELSITELNKVESLKINGGSDAFDTLSQNTVSTRLCHSL